MRFSTAFVALAAPLLAAARPVLVTRAASETVIAVLKFAEILEQLETEFYAQALNKFVAQDFINAGISVPEIAIQNFQDIQAHEAAHVVVLDQALRDNGAEPVTTCSFNFDPVLTDVATMASVARVVEQVGVAAYLGGADLIDDKSFLGAAASILTTEARHQTFLNIINAGTSVPQAFDVALTPSDILAIAGAFVSGCDPAAEIGLPPANAPLAVTNTGTIAPGTKLEFSSPALNETSRATASCQMLAGGLPFSLSFPIDECIVPDGVDGPVWLWLTTDAQPLAADIHVRASDKILAGPTAAFLDIKGSALGALIRTNGSGFSSSETIAPSDASSLLATATATATSGETAPTAAPTTGAVPPISVIGTGFIPASQA